MPEKRPCGECYWFHLEEDLEDYYDAGEGDCWRLFHTTYEDSVVDCNSFKEKEKKICR